MPQFSPTTRRGDCEEIAHPSTAYGRRRRNWIDAHGAVASGQVVDASCSNKHCIALKHAYLRPRVESKEESARRLLYEMSASLDIDSSKLARVEASS